MLAHGFIAQTRTCAVEENRGEHHQQDGQIDHGALVKQQRTDDRDVLQAGDADAGHGGDLLQVGAGAEVNAVDKRRQRRSEYVDGHAVHRMVGAQCHRGKGVDHVHHQTRQCAAQQADPVGAGDVAGQEAHQRTDGRQALQTDVHHTGALTVQLRQRDKQQRNGQTNRSQKQAGDPIHYLSPAFLFANTRSFHALNSGSFVIAMPATENTMTSA